MKNEKVAVITGATSPVGGAVARRLAEEGASLVLAARRSEALDDLVAECTREGVRAVGVLADVCREDDVRKVAARAVDAFGRIDVWINNEGVESVGPDDPGPLADQALIVRTNLLGTLYGTHHAMAQFRRQREGVLINVAASDDKVPAPYYAACSATRFGIIGLGTALREEIRDAGMTGISVCTVLSPVLSDPGAGRRATPLSGRPAQRLAETVADLAEHPREEVVFDARLAAGGTRRNRLTRMSSDNGERRSDRKTAGPHLDRFPIRAMMAGPESARTHPEEVPGDGAPGRRAEGSVIKVASTGDTR